MALGVEMVQGNLLGPRRDDIAIDVLDSLGRLRTVLRVFSAGICRRVGLWDDNTIGY